MLSKRLLAAAAGDDPTYVEDVFSTYLYEGNGSSQVIPNGIDLAGEGGLVWLKMRNGSASHRLLDSERPCVASGNYAYLNSDAANAEACYAGAQHITSLNVDGFTLGNEYNSSSFDYTSWTFRKCPGFFDVIRYTGTGSAQNIAHNLGSVPGCIIVKCVNAGSRNWSVYHRSNTANPETTALYLNTNQDTIDGVDFWNDTAPTDSVFTVNSRDETNRLGDEYVAYLFAHDDQRFGKLSDESIIKCGGFSNVSGSDTVVSLGWEPQYVMVKVVSGGLGNWVILDSMRGLVAEGSNDRLLLANTTASESTQPLIVPTPDGFIHMNDSSNNDFVYIAIRRPMKVPETASEVFAMDTQNGTDPGFISGFPVDLALRKQINSSDPWHLGARLMGRFKLTPNATLTETADSAFDYDWMDGWYDTASSASTTYSWMFKRAVGFLDVVCYDGTGSWPLALNHNLGVIPQMIILKKRSPSSDPWEVYHFGNTAEPETERLQLDSDATIDSIVSWYDTLPTDQQFTVGTGGPVNQSGHSYVAILFATLAGISKVGSYVGTAADLVVDCGFSSGAAFVLIKRVDDVGDWYLWDSVRGIVAAAESHLLLNSSAAQSSNDYIDPDSSGFVVTSSAPAALNANGGNYIFLAIAA